MVHALGLSAFVSRLLQMRVQESAVASQLAVERKQREDAGRALAGMERQFAQVRITAGNCPGCCHLIHISSSTDFNRSHRKTEERVQKW